MFGRLFQSIYHRKEDRKKASDLVQQFKNAPSVDDAFRAANEMKEHLSYFQGRKAKDKIGEAIIDILLPKQRTNTPGVKDLTGGRPDTLEWVAFMLIADIKNHYWYEYLEWLDLALDRGMNVRWIAPILQRLLPSLIGHDKEKCEQVLARMKY